MAQTILVVDDEPNVVLLMQRNLEREGYTVLTARHGGEALAVLREHAVDLVFTDSEMPEMDGPELIRAIRREPIWRNIPILFAVLGFTRNHGKDVGADFYLTKPFCIGQVEGVVKRALAGRGG